MAPPGTGRRPPASREARFSAVSAACRAQPSPAEHSRTQPNAAEPSRAPRRAAAAARTPPSERASRRGRGGGAAPGGGGAGSPQTARGRGRPGRAAAGAAGGGCAAEGEGRGRGHRPCPPPVPPPPRPPRARKLPSLSRRPASRCPGPSRGRAPGSTQAQDCRWTSPLPRSHCVDRTASVEGQLYWSSASAWALPSSQPCGLCWSEGAACHGGSHLPRGPHCHRLQRPRRLPAAAALGHSLLGLPFPLCGHRLSFGIQSQLQPWPLS